MAYFFKVRVCAAMKGIPMHYALDLCAVDKDFFVFCFFQFGKPFYKLVEQILYYFFRLSASEPGKRRVIRHLLSLKKPDKVDILAACKLQFPGGVDAALSCIPFLLQLVHDSFSFQQKNEIGNPFRGSLSHFLLALFCNSP